MSPEEEDACIEELAGLLKEAQPLERVRERCRRLARGYDPVVQKGTLVYARYLRRLQPPARLPADFSERYWEAWQDFLMCAARGGGAPFEIPEISRGPQKLFLGWHFPEYPLWLETACLENVLILVARRSEWMEAIVGHDALCNFREVGLSSMIPRAFRAGRTMFAMMDHCYADSNRIVTDFLGRPAGAPAGLLKLARRFGYEAQLLSQRDGQPLVLDAFAPADFDVVTCVKRTNAVIEKEILRDPPRWLLWALAGDRWEVETTGPTEVS